MSFDLPVLPQGWSYVPLGQLAHKNSVTYGVVQPGSHVGHGIPIVRVNNFKDGRIELTELMRIEPEIERKYGRTRLQGGEVLLTLVGTVGQVAVVPETLNGFNVARAVAVIHPREIDPNWLAICLRSPLSQHLLSSRANTTVQTTINLKDLRALPVPIPPNHERERIVRLIGSLDDRITLLRETNATLEAIAEAMFKSWFIDFDPVRAKAEGLEPEGMDSAAAGLFPNSFEESELGLVPKGWSIGILADLASLNPESWTAKNRPESVAYVDLANTKENVITEVTEYLFKDAPSRARRVLRDGDTIVGTVRPGNRSFAFIANAEANLTGSTGFAVLRPVREESTEFIYLVATSEANIEYLTHIADGGAYPAVRPEVVSSLKCILPSSDVMRFFHGITAPIFKKIASNHRQAKAFTQLRDTLLPRLISGELRLPKTENVTESALLGGEECL